MCCHITCIAEIGNDMHILSKRRCHGMRTHELSCTFLAVTFESIYNVGSAKKCEAEEV